MPCLPDSLNLLELDIEGEDGMGLDKPASSEDKKCEPLECCTGVIKREGFRVSSATCGRGIAEKASADIRLKGMGMMGILCRLKPGISKMRESTKASS